VEPNQGEVGLASFSAIKGHWKEDVLYDAHRRHDPGWERFIRIAQEAAAQSYFASTAVHDFVAMVKCDGKTYRRPEKHGDRGYRGDRHEETKVPEECRCGVHARAGAASVPPTFSCGSNAAALQNRS
jgi:hypothetical protein